MNSAIAYAFGVGMVATFNPCGFAMLPAYLSYFLGLENARGIDDRADATVLRALAVGASMTAGFVVVFGLLGLVLDPILSSVIDKLPWLTIVLGIVLVIAELLTLSFLLLGMGVAAWVVALLQFMFNDFSFSRDVLVFAVASVVFFLVFRKLFKRQTDTQPQPNQDINHY